MNQETANPVEPRADADDPVAPSIEHSDHQPPTILAGTTNPQFSWSVVVWLAILALAALATLFIVAWRNGLAGVAMTGG